MSLFIILINVTSCSGVTGGGCGLLDKNGGEMFGVGGHRAGQCFSASQNRF